MSELEMRLVMTFSPLMKLELHWDEKLSLDVESNPFPLAPVDLVRKKLITSSEYNEQNLAFGKFCNSIMETELLQLSSESNKTDVCGKKAQVLGAGLARDLGWMKKAVDLGMGITVRDISRVAWSNVESLGKSLGIESYIEYKHGEFETGWGQEDSKDIFLVTYASQFIQVQGVRKMRRIMQYLGSLLKTPSREPKRRIYLVHPQYEDNSTPVIWEGEEFPAPKWGDSILHSKHDLVRFAERGLCAPVHLETLGKHMYFHQSYSFLKLVAKV